MSRMQNLTLASAKHLLNMGHITPDHHKKIVAAAMKPMKPMKYAASPAPKINVKPPKQAGAPNIFGALGGAGMLPGIPSGVPGMNAGQTQPQAILSGGDED